MNYNANVGTRPTSVRKPKRVSDVNAMGSPAPPQMQSPYNPYVPGMNTPNPPTQHGYAEYQPQYGVPPPMYPGMQPNMQPMGGPQASFNMLSQPIVQNLAMEYGEQLASTGRTVVKQNIEKFVPVSSLKYYFAVDTKYVVSKLGLLLFPFTHKDWSIKYEQDNPVQPRYEINAPDLYIPTMAYVTYVVIAGLVLGMYEKFTPEQIGIYSSSALAWTIVEIAIYWITLYVTNIDTTLKTLDLLAYSGYKYVGIIAAVLISLVFAKTGYYIGLIYCNLSLAFFLVRSLKSQVLPESQTHHSHYGVSGGGSKRRLYFLLFVAITQPLLSWWLSLSLVNAAPVPTL